MPPEGKPDFEDHELAVLKWWLDSGAAPDTKVGGMVATDEILAMLGKLSPAAPAPADSGGGGDTNPPDKLYDQRQQVESRMTRLPSTLAGRLKL